MDPSVSASGEALLRAWLGLTAAICNRRMVTDLTFNEAVVCNHLLHQQRSAPEEPLTATDLCEKTSLLKSQMNSVLSSLEKQGYLTRSRSPRDRRQVLLTLTSAGRPPIIRPTGRRRRCLVSWWVRSAWKRQTCSPNSLSTSSPPFRAFRSGIGRASYEHSDYDRFRRRSGAGGV